jgi:hypothetical protein
MEPLFGLITLAPLVVWVAMLLFPKTRFTQGLVLSDWPMIVGGGVYALLALALLANEFSTIGFSLTNVQALLSSDVGAITVWAHVQVFNLFVGIWIFRDAKYWGVTPGLYLLGTLVAGPVGLGAYSLYRRRRERSGRDPGRTVN